MHAGFIPSAVEALRAAVAEPDVFSPDEYVRSLRRNHGDVTKAAMQLKAKAKWLAEHQLGNLSLAKPSLQREAKKDYLHVLHDAHDKCKCPIVLFNPSRFKPTSESDKLVAGNELAKDHGGHAEATSTLEDARRYIVYIVSLAIELMEDEHAPGIVYLVDLERASSAMVSDASSVHLQLLQMLKEYFPETTQLVFVLHMAANSLLMRGATSLLLKGLGAAEATAAKVHFVADLRELQQYFEAPSLPDKYGGQYRLTTPAQWMSVQAELEDVDLDTVEQEEAKTYMTKQARELNGMQYAACSVTEVVEMNSTVLRGALYRNKSGLSWVKMYAVLRPDALLLYDDMKGKMPMVIIPINDEIQAMTAQFADAPRGTFGFKIDVAGIPGGHLLCASSEKERSNWLQDIQMGIQSFEEQHAHEVYEEERKIEMDKAFEKLDMIDLSTDLPPVVTPASPAAPTPIKMTDLGALLPNPVNGMDRFQASPNVAQRSGVLRRHLAGTRPNLNITRCRRPGMVLLSLGMVLLSLGMVLLSLGMVLLSLGMVLLSLGMVLLSQDTVLHSQDTVLHSLRMEPHSPRMVLLRLRMELPTLDTAPLPLLLLSLGMARRSLVMAPRSLGMELPSLRMGLLSLCMVRLSQDMAQASQLHRIQGTVRGKPNRGF
ncbi:hypothetical protein SDRG_07172 [Saprolegnia diclina VS20]|uniref:PH domain-containing protein n=1 Tax=Saprolegnia diclina (strain VS20) TaxID=1156394 RepID=T0QC78_SAPDV|nr:hypothetical protein SDRG_07172 [Saprolegnia diclina VS20]EQC35464.1 hypothetical protein SDRG_07172 [Saprolegnia diclina VS20]|eukprot:XP_008611214.1 hypothetical protein SDRG_07172 [Saprolegnia diclina VS20]